MNVDEQREKMEKMKEDGWVFPFDWEPYTDTQIQRAIDFGLVGETDGMVYFPTGEIIQVKLPTHTRMRVDLLQRLFGGQYASYRMGMFDERYSENLILSYNDDIGVNYWMHGKHPRDSGFQLNENVPEIPDAFMEWIVQTDDAVYFEWTGANNDRPPLGGFWGPVVMWIHP